MQYILPGQYGWYRTNDHSCKTVSSREWHPLLKHSTVHTL